MCIVALFSRLDYDSTAATASTIKAGGPAQMAAALTMRLLISDAAETEVSRGISVSGAADSMGDLLKQAARKLHRNTEYEETGSERVFVITGGTHAAMVDDLADIRENDQILVCFNGEFDERAFNKNVRAELTTPLTTPLTMPLPLTMLQCLRLPGGPK